MHCVLLRLCLANVGLINYYRNLIYAFAHRFRFLCCYIMCLYVLSSVLWCPLRFPEKSDVRVILTYSFCRRTRVFIYVICVCLLIVVSYIYCVVFLFRLLYSYIMLPVSLDCPYLIAPSEFLYVYLPPNKIMNQFN